MAWDILPKANLQYFLTKLKNKFLMLTNYNKLGAKNILPFPYAHGSGTVHDLTVTVNNDGSITANGQPTQNVSFTLVSNIITEYGLQVGDKLIFSESNVENNNASAALVYVNPSGPIDLVQGDYELTVTSDMVTKGVAFILWFHSGVDLSTAVTFKPMLRLDTDPDPTWASPAFTNRKLTELVVYLSRNKSHVSANPSSTTGTLTGIEIDGTGYAVQGGGNVQSDWDETDPTDDSYIQNNPKEYLDHHVAKNMMFVGKYVDLGISGCTIRVQYYGEVVIDGTCTADGGAGYCILGQIIQWYGLKAGDVIVFSEKYGYDANKCYFAYRDYGSNTWYPIHDDYEYTVTGNETVMPEAGAIQFGIYVKANTFDNYILRPMCRLKGQDDSWEFAAPNDIHTGLWINAFRNGTARDNTKVAKSGDTISGTFAPSSDRGANIGADNQRINYLWAYRIVGVTSIEKSANSGAYRQFLQDKTGNIALLEDMKDWVDITSLCTWGTGVTDYSAYLNGNLKLIQFRGICPTGMANQGLLLTLPSGTTVKDAQFLGNFYDEVKNMHIDIVADNSNGIGIVKSSHSIGQSTGIRYTFGGMLLIN